MRKNVIWIIIAVVVVVLWVVIYSQSASSSPRDTTVKKAWRYQWTIHVGHMVALDMAPMFIAKEAGFFQDEGLDVQTSFFTNPGDSNAALAGWSLQFNINPFTLPYLWENQGIPMRIISSAGGLGIIQVVIQSGFAVDSLASLKTRVANHPNQKLKIWTLKWDTLDMIVYRALKEQWLTYDDFEMVWFNDLLAMVQAFQTQQIDILSHIKPYTTDLVKNYGAKVLTDSDKVRGFWTPNTTTIVLQDFMDQYPETVKAYLRAQQRWFQMLVDDPVRAVDLLVKGNYYRVDRDVLLYALQHQPKQVILQPNVAGMMIAIGDMEDQWYIQKLKNKSDVYVSKFLEELHIK